MEPLTIRSGVSTEPDPVDARSVALTADSKSTSMLPEPAVTSQGADGTPVIVVRPLSVVVINAPETPFNSIALEVVPMLTGPAPVNDPITRPLPVRACRPPLRPRAVIALLDVV